MTYEQIPVNPGSPRTKRIVLIVVGAVLALCCVGGAVGGFFVYGAYKEATGPAQATVRIFSDALVARDFPTAYGQLCRQERERTSQDEFTRMQSAQPELRSYDLVGLNVTNSNGRVRGVATVHLVAESGAETTQVFNLVKEDGSWRVCR